MAKTPFSRNLKSLRQAHGISQQKLAQEVGLKRSNIASYETGSVEPNAINFLKISFFFEASPSDFLGSELSGRPLPLEAAIASRMMDPLHQFFSKTRDAEKIAQGFTEYLRLHPDHPDSSELRRILKILEYLVDINKQFINQQAGVPC